MTATQEAPGRVTTGTDELVVASAPLRISLGGGGTDLPFYADRHGADVLSVAISPRVTVAARTGRLDARFRYSHDRVLLAPDVDDLDEPYVRAALRATGTTRPTEITSFGAVPPGTGLGSSGAFTVALLAALGALTGQDPLGPGRSALAERAWQLEAGTLGRPVGRHDHYVCATGGLCRLVVEDGRPQVIATRVEDDTLEALDRRLRLYYTGVSRESSHHLAAAPASVDDRTARLHETRRIGAELLGALERGDVDRVPELFRRHWTVKQAGLPPAPWDEALQVALDAGALGGKLVGAGGGGFLLLFAPPAAQATVDAAMTARGLVELPFTFSRTGAQITRVRHDDQEALA
ncbi:GHMP kinase [Cellulomonas flavigena DSM 20109]|uniref:GHMP kinase n=1 Tax=Cellulomonas flavigena (strain ATCC 482 / DSM 20109 / BCRC 11376 / JCM 18109 / NBRC 3775 / NCIMB 8073 / NRS 134) TaxID=446466 RepID=D5UDL5_CELFN|nr:GHMP kinase [Cellulomonas flavigena]ADG76471.1 GHMP kinase [Cellulomonas flavigena DSM 20109]